MVPHPMNHRLFVLRTENKGRLVITFRGMAHQSSTKGDFVAWVGEYEDIVNVHEGQYRVRLLDNKSALGIPDIPD